MRPTMNQTGARWDTGLATSTAIRRNSSKTVSTSRISVLCMGWKVGVSRPATFDGPRLGVDYALKQKTPWRSDVDVTLRIRLNGLGFAITEVETLGFTLRLVGLATLVAERDTSHLLLMSMRKQGRSLPGKAFWRCAQMVLGPFVMGGLMNQINQDDPVWTNKKYLRRPAIADCDGPIHAYRRWVSQFIQKVQPGDGGQNPAATVPNQGRH